MTAHEADMFGSLRMTPQIKQWQWKLQTMEKHLGYSSKSKLVIFNYTRFKLPVHAQS